MHTSRDPFIPSAHAFGSEAWWTEMRAKAVAKRLAVEKQIRETGKRGEKSFGAFRDDPLYDEAMRLGREWRVQANRGAFGPEWDADP